jgi:RNA chaperone ProQ/FINO-like protein
MPPLALERLPSLSDALALARAHRVSVAVAGGRLVFVGADRTPPADVVAILRRVASDLLPLIPPGDRGRPEDWRSLFKERAAVAEQSGLARAEAEARAFECCVIEWLNRRLVGSSPDRCCWCGGMEDVLGAGVLLPFGIGPHAWLHRGCCEAWRDWRREEAVAALAAFEIRGGTEMGPHPGRKKLTMRSLKQRTSEKTPAPAEVKPPPHAERPKPPPGPGAGLTVAEQRQRNQARRDALAWLRNAFPALFGYPPLPLAVGIGKAIVAVAIEAGRAKHATRAALHYWVHGHAYLVALAAPGAMRCGLDGQAVEAVDPQHQAEAARLIAEIDEARSKRAAGRRLGPRRSTLWEPALREGTNERRFHR